MKKALLSIIDNVMLNLFQHRKVVRLCGPDTPLSASEPGSQGSYLACSLCQTSSGRRIFCLIISLFISQVSFAYQTVLVDFPVNQGWHPVCYDEQSGETILQYTPIGQTGQLWTKTVVFHSYKNLPWTNSAARLMDRLTQQMELQNSTQLYRYIKYTEADSIATRCVQKNAYIPTQCEIFRVSKSFEGLISMHYINKYVDNFKNTYNLWYQIMKSIRIYYSYYMDDRILNKATSFEL